MLSIRFRQTAARLQKLLQSQPVVAVAAAYTWFSFPFREFRGHECDADDAMGTSTRLQTAPTLQKASTYDTHARANRTGCAFDVFDAE